MSYISYLEVPHRCASPPPPNPHQFTFTRAPSCHKTARIPILPACSPCSFCCSCHKRSRCFTPHRLNPSSPLHPLPDDYIAEQMAPQPSSGAGTYGKHRLSTAPPSTTSTTVSNKQRQLSHLNSQLAHLHSHLSDLEDLVRMTAVQAEHIRALGGIHGAL